MASEAGMPGFAAEMVNGPAFGNLLRDVMYSGGQVEDLEGLRGSQAHMDMAGQLLGEAWAKATNHQHTWGSAAETAAAAFPGIGAQGWAAALAKAKSSSGTLETSNCAVPGIT